MVYRCKDWFGQRVEIFDWPDNNLAIRPGIKKINRKSKDKVCLAMSLVVIKAATKRWAKTKTRPYFV